MIAPKLFTVFVLASSSLGSSDFDGKTSLGRHGLRHRLLKQDNTGLAQRVDAVEADLSSEEAARIAADNAEAAARQAADAALETVLADEVSAREAGDAALQSSLDAEVSARAAADANLEAADAAETASREAADAALQAAIDAAGTSLANEVAARQSGDVNILAALTTETSAREDAVAALQTAINGVGDDVAVEEAARVAAVSGEEAARTAADDALGVRIDGLDANLAAETTARENADAGLRADLDTEVAARQNGDSTLQSNLDDEAAARAAADVAEVADRQAADTALETALAGEAADRQAADGNLQTALDAEETARIAADDSLVDADAAETSNREAADGALRADLDAVSDTALQAVADAATAQDTAEGAATAAAAAQDTADGAEADAAAAQATADDAMAAAAAAQATANLDNNNMNEVNTGLALDGTTLKLTDAGGVLTVDLSPLGDDADNDPNNELQKVSIFNGELVLDQGGGSVPYDADPNNELQSLSRKNGNIITLSHGGGSVSVADDDNDATNELNNKFELVSDELQLTDAGGTLTVDLSSIGDDLGNHKATQALDMSFQDIFNVNYVFAARFYDKQNPRYYLDPASISFLNDLRVNILYDGNDSGYYLDPASTSHLNDLRVNILYDRQNTNYYVHPASSSYLYNLRVNGVLSSNSNDSYDKLRVHSSSSYTIGMKSAMTFGHLNDWAMTFTMYDDADRGFLWRDTNDATDDGAMSLTTDGRLTVKQHITANKYYGSANRGYYLDPSGTSRLNQLTVVSRIDVGSVSVSASNGGTVTASRFEDRNDPNNYYLDPSSTSRLNRLSGVSRIDAGIVVATDAYASTSLAYVYRDRYSSNHFLVPRGNSYLQSLTVYGTFSNPSDERIKHDITPFEDGLDTILAINPVNYKLNREFADSSDPDKEYVGVIAQDMASVAPYAVNTFIYNSPNTTEENTPEAESEALQSLPQSNIEDGEELLSVEGTSLIYTLINAVKELNRKIEVLEEEIQSLQAH